MGWVSESMFDGQYPILTLSRVRAICKFPTVEWHRRMEGGSEEGEGEGTVSDQKMGSKL